MFEEAKVLHSNTTAQEKLKWQKSFPAAHEKGNWKNAASNNGGISHWTVPS
jgi:hypothetical protein